MGSQNGKQLKQNKSLQQVLINKDNMKISQNNKYQEKVQNNKEELYKNDEQSNSNNIVKQLNDEKIQNHSYIINCPPLPQNLNDKPIEVSYLNCLKHKDQQINSININPKASQKLCCMDCVFLKEYELSDFIKIQQFYNDLKSNKFKPHFVNAESDQNFNEQLFNKTNQESNIVQILQNKFQNFKKEINKFIDEYEKQIEQSINNYELCCENLRQKYDELNLETIKNEILSNNNLSNSELEKLVQEFLNKQQTELKKQVLQFTVSIEQYNKEFKTTEEIFQDKIVQFTQDIDLFKVKIPQNIFEQIDSIDIKYQLFQKLKKSNQSQKELQIQVNNQKEIELFQDISHHAHSQYYFDSLLDNNHKYELLLEFNGSSDYYCFFFGLQSKTNINSQWLQHYKFFIPNQFDCNFQNNINVDKGQSITRLQQKKNEIKVQICIKDKIFRWKFGDNINSIKDWTTFKSNDNHYFSLEMYDNKGKIIIKSGNIVKNFEKW